MRAEPASASSGGALGAASYDEFRARLRGSGCNRCPDLCGGRANIVVDRGNPGAAIVAIGEGPGENEDREGRSFVGRSGKLLDQVMASVGIDTDRDLLILNVVKCRPPGNRAPTREEAANCRPYLEWQLKTVAPRVILLLGATAARHFMPALPGGMKESVGRFFKLDRHPDVTFMLLYHPAYLLRDPRKRAEMQSHVEALSRHLAELKIHSRRAPS